MVLRWLDAALDDLRAIKVYIAEENPDAARRVIASIRSEADILINQPTIGRAGRIADTRELVISQYPYIVAYREQRGEVHRRCVNVCLSLRLQIQDNARKMGD